MDPYPDQHAHPHTFQSTTTPEVFALGPAAGPASSGAPRACFQAETPARSIRRSLTQRPCRRATSPGDALTLPSA